jgi:hypothetical protein
MGFEEIPVWKTHRSGGNPVRLETYTTTEPPSFTPLWINTKKTPKVRKMGSFSRLYPRNVRVMRQTKRYLLCWSGVSLRFSTKVATARRIRSLSLMECFSQMSVISFLSASLIRRQVWYSYFIIGSYPYFWLDLRFTSISGHHLFRCSVTLTCGAKYLLTHRW